MAKLGGWVAKMVTRLAAKPGLSGSNPDMSKNYKINNIYKGVANTKQKIHIQTANLLAAKLHPILSYDICMYVAVIFVMGILYKL
jgi:hypothetical protein